MVQTHWKCSLQSTETSQIYISLFLPCFPEFILHWYKTQVLPILEYGCAIWDPHLKKDKILLENVQYFAIPIATKSLSPHNSSLPYELPSLESQWQYHKLLHTLKFLNGLSFCPFVFFFTIKSKPNLRIITLKLISTTTFRQNCIFFQLFFC